MHTAHCTYDLISLSLFLSLSLSKDLFLSLSLYISSYLLDALQASRWLCLVGYKTTEERFESLCSSGVVTDNGEDKS